MWGIKAAKANRKLYNKYHCSQWTGGFIEWCIQPVNQGQIGLDNWKLNLINIYNFKILCFPGGGTVT